MHRILTFIKKEIVLVISFLAALVSCFFVTPDGEYLGYFDVRTLALLYCLMVVVAGFMKAGLFKWMAQSLCVKVGSLKIIALLLVLFSFFSAMFITNDVALLTFVPLAIIVLRLGNLTMHIPWVVILQTVAANLGSMLTPVGNPQNIYIQSFYEMSVPDFVRTTFPVWGLSLVILVVLALLMPKKKITCRFEQKEKLNTKWLVLYLLLFVVCLLVVCRVFAWWYMLGAVIIVLLIFDRRTLLKADFFLLLTFAFFFIFSGNIARIEAVDTFLRSIMNGREILTGAVTSQVISNVPATLLLSNFTGNAKGLLLGVNIGGLGTPIASLASLISFKIYSNEEGEKGKGFVWKFLVLNFALLIGFLAVALLFHI